MRALHLVAAALIFSTSAQAQLTSVQAQLTGTSTQEFGGANPPIPDLSMCVDPPAATATYPHVWVVDPVNGHTVTGGGNGSSGSPWNSLQAVFSSVAGYPGPLLTTANGGVGPIAPGDEVLLMSGTAAQYGTILIGTGGVQMTNPSYLTIAAAPGQTPFLHTLTVLNATKLSFLNISVQSAGSGGANPILVPATNGVGFITKDIHYNGMSLSSADDATFAGWTQAQVIANKSQGFLLGSNSFELRGTSCIRVTNSRVKYTMNSVTLAADNSILDNNEFDHFLIDDIDFMANNLVIYHNYLHDAINLADGSHQDAMQAFQNRVSAHDILIDSNTIIFQTEHLPFELTTPATYNGGIDNTDQDYTRITVTNNVVVWPNHNIQWSSCHDCLIAGNTALPAVIQSSSPAQNGGDIGVILPKSQFLRGTNDIIKNNYSAILSISEPTTIVKGNVMSASSVTFPGCWYVDGVTSSCPTTPGTYGSGHNIGNVIDSGGIPSEITTFNNGTSGTWAYDFHLISSAPARGAGVTTAPMPTVDIAGIVRAAAHDSGAYSFN